MAHTQKRTARKLIQQRKDGERGHAARIVKVHVHALPVARGRELGAQLLARLVGARRNNGAETPGEERGARGSLGGRRGNADNAASCACLEMRVRHD